MGRALHEIIRVWRQPDDTNDDQPNDDHTAGPGNPTPAPDRAPTRCGCRVPLIWDAHLARWRHLDDLSRCDPDHPRWRHPASRTRVALLVGLRYAPANPAGQSLAGTPGIATAIAAQTVATYRTIGGEQ